MKNKTKKSSYTTKQKIVIWALAIIAFVCFSLAGLQGVYLYQRDKTDTESDAQTINKKDQDIEIEDTEHETNENNTVLKKTKDAGREYIDETLFLGDSNTARFLGYLSEEDQLPLTTVENTIAVAGIGIDGISSTACMRFYTGTFTMVDSVRILQPKRIIMTFGTNNLGGSLYATDFAESYAIQIERVKEAYPYAEIIINSIPPVSLYTTYTNVQLPMIESYNAAIKSMCEKKGYHYLNSYEALIDKESGYAKLEYMSEDGLHLSEIGANALFQYIRTHALLTEDKRPMPLAEIPGIIGPDTNMLAIDPLTNQAFTQEVAPQVTATPIPQEIVPQEEVTPTIEPTPETPVPEATVAPTPIPPVVPEAPAEEVPEAPVEG